MTQSSFLRMMALSTALIVFPPLAMAAPPLPKGFDTDCIDSPFLDCSVYAAGFIGLYDDAHIAFQIQRGYSEDTGSGAAVMLFESIGDEWVLLASDDAGVHYEAPRLVEGDQIILHVPGFMQGTGSFNADLLFLRDYEGGDWQKIDIESWRDEIDALLPEGLEIWKGVDFDFGDWFWANYNARTPLWQQSDANCCPTGGWAEIEFEITDGRLVPVKVHYREE